MIYDNKVAIDILDTENCINILFSFSYVMKTYKSVQHINFLQKIIFMIEKIIIKKYQKHELHNFFCVVNFPRYFHSKQLIHLQKDPFVPFTHQIEYMKNITEESKLLNITICASPVSSGKSVNTISSCYYQSIKNHKNRSSKLTLILAPKLVIDEIARGCNANSQINYWYFYQNKLVPSKKCCLLMNNNKHYFLDKPNFYKQYLELKDKKDDKNINIPENLEYYIYREYLYYKEKRKEYLNNKKFKKNIELPDVIFAILDENNLNNFTRDILFNQHIETIIIDEFLMPGILPTMKYFLNKLLLYRELKNLILISASAPSCVDLFKKEYSDLIGSLRRNHRLKYIYQNILPCFLRIHVKNHESKVFKTWLPHYNFIRDIKNDTYTIDKLPDFVQNLKWYHLRLYGPISILHMMNIYEKKFGEVLFEVPNFNKFTEITSNYLNFNHYKDEQKNKNVLPDTFIDLIFHFFMKLFEKVTVKQDLIDILSYEPKPFYCDFLDYEKKKKKETWLYVNSTNFILQNLQDETLVKETYANMQRCILETDQALEKLKSELKEYQSKLQSDSKDKRSKKQDKDKSDIIEECKQNKLSIQKQIDILENKINNYPMHFNCLNNISQDDFSTVYKIFKNYFNRSNIETYCLIYYMLEGHILYIDNRKFETFLQEKKIIIKSVHISYNHVFGTDFDIYGIEIQDCPDLVTLVQALGRVGRARKYIEVPAIIDDNATFLLM